MPKPASHQIAIIGVDIRKNSFHVVGPRQARRDCPAAKMVAWPG